MALRGYGVRGLRFCRDWGLGCSRSFWVHREFKAHGSGLGFRV